MPAALPELRGGGVHHGREHRVAGVEAEEEARRSGPRRGVVVEVRVLTALEGVDQPGVVGALRRARARAEKAASEAAERCAAESAHRTREDPRTQTRAMSAPSRDPPSTGPERGAEKRTEPASPLQARTGMLADSRKDRRVLVDRLLVAFGLLRQLSPRQIGAELVSELLHLFIHYRCSLGR